MLQLLDKAEVAQSEEEFLKDFTFKDGTSLVAFWSLAMKHANQGSKLISDEDNLLIADATSEKSSGFMSTAMPSSLVSLRKSCHNFILKCWRLAYMIFGFRSGSG